MKNINLGCGTILRKNCINVDKFGNPDIKHDLDKYPYPFEKNTIDNIYAFHILEHLKDPLYFFNEIYRILKKNGRAFIKCPHYKSRTAYANFGHRNFFDENAIDFITTNKMSDLSANLKFKLIQKKVLRGRFFWWRKKEIIWIIQK